MSADLLSVEDFAPHVGTPFVLAEDGGAEAILFEAKPLRPHADGAFRPPFSLLFRIADQQVLPQRMYALRHDAMGALDLFLVPIARDPDGVTYEAAFN